jgi:hypothetical protein
MSVKIRGVIVFGPKTESQEKILRGVAFPGDDTASLILRAVLRFALC